MLFGAYSALTDLYRINPNYRTCVKNILMTELGSCNSSEDKLRSVTLRDTERMPVDFVELNLLVSILYFSVRSDVSKIILRAHLGADSMLLQIE